MKKRKWQDTNDLNDLELSRSTLRSLNVMEGIRDDLDRIQNDLDSVQNAREGLNSVEAALDDTNIIGKAEADIKRVHLENIRGAYAGVREADARIPSGIEKLEGRMADARFTKPRIPSTSILQELGTASRIHGLLGALPEAARRPSPVTPLVSSIIKASDASKGLVNLEPPRLFSKMAGIEGSWSGMTISPGSYLGKAGFGLIDKDLRVSSLRSPSILNDLQGSSVLKYLQSSSALTETRRALFPKALTEIFGANNTLANLSVATPNRMFDLIRGMETDLNNVWHRMMPTLDSIGRHWSGMLEALPRIDWEAVERAARIREARRPRTRIGFAALNAYDELYMGHPWVADEFLLDYLGIEPSADRREALWIVLRQAFERTVPYPARWIVLDDKRAAAYLRTSVYRQARRVERNRERPDRVWWTERDPKTKKKIELPRPVQPEHDIEVMAEGSGNPADIVANYMDDRAKVILLLYEKGSNEDKEFIRLFLTGHSQADIARDYGWAKVLRFTRKAERWRIKHNPPIDG